MYKCKKHKLAKDTLLTILLTLGKEWRVTHDFKPTQYLSPIWANSLHLTSGGNSEHYGARTPGIWPSMGDPSKSYIASAVNGENSYIYRPDRPPVDVWTSVEISQTLEGERYMYRIIGGGQEVHAVENTQPQEFQGVKVYASDPWHEAQPGSIRNLVIETRLQVRWWTLLTLSRSEELT